MPSELVLAAPFHRCAVLASAKRKELNPTKQNVFSQAMVIMAFSEFTEIVVKEILRVWRRLDDKAAQKEPEAAARLLQEFVSTEKPNNKNLEIKDVETCLYHVLKKPTTLKLKTALIALLPKTQQKESFRAGLSDWSKSFSNRLEELAEIASQLSHGKQFSETDLAENANLYISDFSRIAKSFTAVLKDRVNKLVKGSDALIPAKSNVDYWAEDVTLVSEVLPKLKGGTSLPPRNPPGNAKSGEGGVVSSLSVPEAMPWYLAKNNATDIVYGGKYPPKPPLPKGNGRISKLAPIKIKLKRGEGYIEEVEPLTDLAEDLNVRKKRCTLWPDCYKGNRCKFLHPTKKCLDFPFCNFGTECLYIHPYCPHRECENQFCPYMHKKPRRFNYELDEAIVR